MFFHSCTNRCIGSGWGANEHGYVGGRREEELAGYESVLYYIIH